MNEDLDLHAARLHQAQKLDERIAELEAKLAEAEQRRVLIMKRPGFGRRNVHCSNCGDERGGMFGHEISECKYRHGMTAEEVAQILPEHLRAKFWEQAVERYLNDELGELDALAAADSSSQASAAGGGETRPNVGASGVRCDQCGQPIEWRDDIDWWVHVDAANDTHQPPNLRLFEGCQLACTPSDCWCSKIAAQEEAKRADSRAGQTGEEVMADPDFTLAFVADPDPAASRVLARHHPDVPNLGDITKVDWTTVGHVDVLTAGYPCQPLSLAGRRAGLADERWIWDDVFAAIRDLRPRIVLLENVAGHLSLGFGRVLGDLASIGFDARWMCLRASDIGAAHRRERVFIWAYRADSPRQRHRDGGATLIERLPAAAEPGGNPALVPTPGARLGKCTSITPATAERRLSHGKNNLDDWAALLPTPRASANENRQTKRTPSQETGTHGLNLAAEVCTLFPTPRATDGTNGGPNQRGSSGDLMLPSAVVLLPTPTVADSRGTRNATADRTDPNGGHHKGTTLSDVTYAKQWGSYSTAIARWAHAIGRPAPQPTEPSRSDAVRLAPRFVEWLMGLPDGWVTDVAGLSRNDMLRLLGNGVVPQQAASAMRRLLAVDAGRVPEAGGET